MKRKEPLFHSVLFLLIAGIVLLAGEAAAEGVRARYLENSGNRTVLELVIEKPAPSSVIVSQFFPPGTVIQEAVPRYSKLMAKKNEVKWLFKRPQPGVRKIILQFAAPLKTQKVRAVVRCKSPVDGTLMTITVQ